MSDLKYSKEHEWVRLEGDVVGELVSLAVGLVEGWLVVGLAVVGDVVVIMLVVIK